MLDRVGCEVTVHERVEHKLSERGAGITTHPEFHAAFGRIGIPMGSDYGVPVEERINLAPEGHVLARYHLKQLLTSWGQLHQSLFDALPPDRIHLGSRFVGATQRNGKVTAAFADGTSIEADLLIGVDGTRSTVRERFWPEARPRYVGYVAWRCAVEEARISRASHDVLFTRLIICLPPGEHVVGYPVAGVDGDARPGHRRFNLAWYRVANEETLRRMLTDETGRHHEGGIPPHLIDRRFIAELKQASADRLPPPCIEVIDLAEQPFFQMIVDLEVETLVRGRIVLAGDAGFTARPHAGMGVTKAAGDAVALADALLAHPDDVERALAVYDAARCQYGRLVVNHARWLGTQSASHARTPEEAEIGRYIRQPEVVIRETSRPPASSPPGAGSP